VKTRRTRAFVFGLALSCALFACAAGDAAGGDEKAKPDFSGTWALDKSKSNYGPFAASPAAREEVTLEIVHREPELRVTRRSRAEGRGERTQESVFYTDGRGELNPPTLGRIGTKTKTGWEGGKIVARARLERRAADGRAVTFEVSEKWEPSADGRTLTQTASAGSPSGVQTVRLVFRRAA
jgi:hypothetical protein